MLIKILKMEHGLFSFILSMMSFIPTLICFVIYHWYVMAGKIALVISNISALPAVYLTIYTKSLGISAIILSSMIWSIIYHICDSELLHCDQRTYLSFQFMDFTNGIALVSLMSLYVSFHNIDRDNSIGRFIYNFLLMIEIFLNYTNVLEAQYIVMIVAGPAFLLLVAQTIYSRCQNNTWPDLSLIDGFISIILIILALVFQFVLAPVVNYPIFHSLWHMTIYFSVFFVYNMHLVNRIIQCCRRNLPRSPDRIAMRRLVENIADDAVNRSLDLIIDS